MNGVNAHGKNKALHLDSSFSTPWCKTLWSRSSGTCTRVFATQLTDWKELNIRVNPLFCVSLRIMCTVSGGIEPQALNMCGALSNFRNISASLYMVQNTQDSTLKFESVILMRRLLQVKIATPKLVEKIPRSIELYENIFLATFFISKF